MSTTSGAITADDVRRTLATSFETAKRGETPYRHWFLENCLPPGAVDEINSLPFAAPSLDGVSGKRELHNATRTYFDADNRGKFTSVAAVADALQSTQTTRLVERVFGCPLDGTYLRIEYAQDIDGFWLQPHTDLGVKKFTFLLYMSKDAGHADLGTDIYDIEQKHVGRSPFKANGAMIFIPSDITYHGFEPRPIQGVRKSIIINYVTPDWRAREQLAFPDQPIRH